MANNKTYDNPIDKHIPWDGSEATDNLPVRGKRVEEFLKDQLSHKAGVFYYDTTNNRYLVFADLETRDEYLEDTTKIDLILGTFDAPFNYSAKIILETPIYNTIALGTTGNYLDFSFAIENKSGQPTGESVVCTYTFRKGSIKQVVTEQYAAGRNIHLNIDKYLSEGTNNITIAIQGNTTLAATTVSVVFQVVNLNLNTEMDISTPYDLRSGSKTMTIPFTISGYGTKIVEWYIDGQKLDFVKDEDEVVDVEVSRTKYITLSNLSQGTHNLQLRAYTTVDGELFYSNTLYREFIIYTGISEEIITAISTDIPSEYGIIETRKLYGLTQYIPYNLIFATFTPGNSTISEVEIKLGDIMLGSLLSENDKVNVFSITASNVGNNTISIISGNTVSSIPVEVLPTTMKISEITNNLQLDFRAIGKNNNSNDKDSWTYGDYSATFSGFNWNNTSGWVGNSLVLNAGASFGINLKPLSPNPSTLGKTIEIEFLTKNVNDDNAIICDLRSETTGAGILITATKLSLISEAGVVIETPFKNNESLRVAFVINKSSGSTNKCMSFIYINGKLARGTSWASSDRYISDRELLFTGTTDAEVEIKYIRIYDTALGNDQILNNHILYRSNITEMNEIYDRNDIYLEGTTTFDYEKMVGRLPVMIVTGNIPTLENTTNKDEQITVDIDYINLQYPEHSFSWKSAALRPQGTSSMGYPKKNFRPYSRKLDSTVCYDNLGKIVQDRLYSFKPGAQRVDCWCLKADYAESSGTHNTGIARLWNKVLVDAKIEHTNILGEKVSGNVLRTSAQQLAISSGFEYDVRTTIDGFPILLFYRLTVDDPLIFLGKYNFNNDKSTPSVFGFEGIPGFDNTKMQCWEILNNGNPLALFTSFENFDNTWGEAFESRYPDTKTPNTADLKGFCKWMSGVTQGDFTRQKWEHLDIYKVAAYYVYLMRFGAVDQTVKNAMLTSEDGQKFYFINYDNDTINGLTNEGKLVVPWDATRETLGIDGQPYYAGPGSKLWNTLEADSEFMEIVRLVDEALYIVGLKYEDIIKMFDEEQAGKWVERVYNQDAQYKYIGPYVERGVNNLFMLQGDRSTHRKYWLARRFALFDSLWVSGAYKANSVEIKCTNNTPAGQQITIKAGTTMDYGYGINNLPRESNVSLSEGEEHTFITSEVVNLGDPIRIYAAPNIESIDLSAITEVLAVVTIDKVYNEDTGTKLKKLIIGNATAENNSVTDISGLAQAERLEYLDVRNMKGLTSLDLSKHDNLSYLDARGSNIANISFSTGGALQTYKMPAAMQTLTLEQLPYLTSLESENNFMTLRTISIKDCPVVKNFQFVYNWRRNTQLDPKTLELEMTGVEWVNVDANELITLGSIGKIDLKGVVYVNFVTQEQVDALSAIFGSDCFDKGSAFRIYAPDGIFISGPTEVKGLQSIELSAAVFSENVGRVEWSLDSTSYATIEKTGDFTALLTAKESSSDRSVTVTAKHYPTSGDIVNVTKTITILKITRVTSGTITGPTGIALSGEYIFNPSPTVYDLPYTVTWSLTGDAASAGYVSITSQNNTSCKVDVIQKVSSSTFNVVATVNNGKSSFTKTLSSIKIGVGVTLRITSNQLDDISTFESLTSNNWYVNGSSKSPQWISGQTQAVAPGDTVKIVFKSVTGYKTPDTIEVVVGEEDIVKTATYLAEQVEVSLSATDGRNLSGTTVKINGTQYTWNGTPIKVKIAFDKSYTIEFSRIADCFTLATQTITASQAIRTVNGLYEPLSDDVVIIDQTITDPETMISGGVNSSIIQQIRAGSHRYLGKYTTDRQMTICQLSDADSTKYADGTDAALTGAEGDVFMKMPDFWYRATEIRTDVWGLQFRYGSSSPGDGWIKWDTNVLIGAYEAYSEGEKLYSRSGVTCSDNISQENFKAYARARGNGFQIVDWQMHCVMAILFYAQYGHTNCQDKIGNGKSTSNIMPSGQTDVNGMNDTKGISPVSGLNDLGADGNAQSINFWGLENWWGNLNEWVDNVVVDKHEWKITEPDGTVRTPGKFTVSTNYISKMIFGDCCDLIPSAVFNSGSSTMGFCDYYYSSSLSTRLVLRSGSYAGTGNGVAFVNINLDPSFSGHGVGSRLAFRGNCIINNNVEEFKSLTAIS